MSLGFRTPLVNQETKKQRDAKFFQHGRCHTQCWVVQTSLPHTQTSLQLSGLVRGYNVCSDHIMQIGLS